MLNVVSIDYLKKLDKLCNYLDSSIEGLRGVKVDHQKRYYLTFLDFFLKSSKNLRALKILLSQDDEFMFGATAQILRSIAADNITIAYLMTFIDSDKEKEQVTFYNELNCLNTEFVLSFKKANEFLGEHNLGQFDLPEEYLVDGKVISKKKLHESSDVSILGAHYPYQSKFVTEDAKYQRLGRDQTPVPIVMCFAAYKYFSNYYHFSELTGAIIRNLINKLNAKNTVMVVDTCLIMINLICETTGVFLEEFSSNILNYRKELAELVED